MKSRTRRFAHRKNVEQASPIGAITIAPTKTTVITQAPCTSVGEVRSVGGPPDPSRDRPDLPTHLDAAVQLAAVLVLEYKGLEGGGERGWSAGRMRSGRIMLS